MTETGLFDYVLPEELIAQYPINDRDTSRLLVIDRGSGRTADRIFLDLPEYLNKGDVLVFNDTRVLKARLLGRRNGTGANIELLLTKRLSEEIWEALARPAKRLRHGDEVVFGDGLKAIIKDKSEEGLVTAEFITAGSFMDELERYGHTPLPPYIRRSDEEDDANRYQTVYAKVMGSVAAPTAGLHFTETLMERVRRKGAEIVFITLHVGIGTFQPVKTEIIEEHRMHKEFYSIKKEALCRINLAKAEGRRVISVGTTSLRCLESAGKRTAEHGWQIPELNAEGETDIFIYPGSRDVFMSDSLITNFHLPKSTLFMLVCAFYDREKMLRIYMDAIEKRYRFFSYGDAMLII